MFDTPILRWCLKHLSRFFLKLSGWKVSGSLPLDSSCVLIAAPHTSNWDLVYMLWVSFVLGIPIHWLGKAQIFKFPFKRIMQWMGGIPVDRSQSNNMVDYAAGLLRDNQNFILVVPPEGTRTNVTYWKTGFYYIAHQATVPIYLGFLDYQKKIGGIGPAVLTTGNFEQDMIAIKSFYQDIQGKYPSLHQ